MCGIAGMIGIHFDDEICNSIIATMIRRGPDDQGMYKNKECALLHRRLSVRDPSGGMQPMVLDWAGERYVIVYNGEQYNTDELRNELKALGHTFCNRSDTEVVLHAFAQWGEAALHKLNGIFSFAVWQEKAQRLFLARDRMGVKPLFYKLHDGGIIFASEIKSILKYPTVRPQIDAEGASQIILLGPGRIPGSAVFKDIKELEPGCCAEFNKGKLAVSTYWTLKDRAHKESFEETVEHVRWLVLDAINRQTVSDVPIGTFLSGGLDSSVISAVCSEKMREKGQMLHTFSVDYADNEKYFVAGKFQPESDNGYIDIMRKYLGTDHRWTVLDPHDLFSALEPATRARDLPGMADVDFSLLAFCGQIKRTVKVALSGECADEIFGGYPWFRDPEIRATEGFPWAQNTHFRSELMSKDLKEQVNANEFVMDLYRSSIAECDILPETTAEDAQVKQMTWLNQRWFMQTLLDRKDRMSMYNGLEVRVPFCDHRIAEYLYGVPWQYKNYMGREKGLLRCAMKGIVPEQILWRKKSPYPKTFDPMYLNLVTESLKDILLKPDEPIFRLMDKASIQRLLTEECKWPWYGQLMRRPQTIAYILQINYWMKDYNVIVV